VINTSKLLVTSVTSDGTTGDRPQSEL